VTRHIDMQIRYHALCSRATACGNETATRTEDSASSSEFVASTSEIQGLALKPHTV